MYQETGGSDSTKAYAEHVSDCRKLEITTYACLNKNFNFYEKCGKFYDFQFLY